jgi:hypothetical protein
MVDAHSIGMGSSGTRGGGGRAILVVRFPILDQETRKGHIPFTLYKNGSISGRRSDRLMFVQYPSITECLAVADSASGGAGLVRLRLLKLPEQTAQLSEGAPRKKMAMKMCV